MMNLIAAALVAAAPAPADAPMQHQQMGQMQPGQMGDMKPGAPGKKDDCCCKDMKAKMDGKHAGLDDQHQS